MTTEIWLWWLMGLLATVGVARPTWPKATVHDPISALISGVIDLFAGGGGLLGGLFGGAEAAGAGAAAGADAFAAGTGALDALTASLPAAGGAAGGTALAADAALPALASTAAATDLGGGALAADVGLAGAAGGGAADVLGALGPGVGDLAAGGGAGLDFGGGGVGAGLTTATPGSTALTSVAPLGAATTPAAAAPPAEFLAASSLDPTAGAAGGTAAATPSLSGPVASNFDPYLGMNVTPGENLGGASATSGGAAAAGGRGILDKVLPAGVSSFIKDNKDLLTLGAAGLPLAAMLFQGTPSIPGLKAAKGTAADLTQQGRNLSAESQALTGEALSGALPPGYEAAIEQAKNAATTRISNQYGALNLSGSTSEAVDKANVAASVDAQRATILNDFLTKGLTAAGAATGATSAAGNQDLELARIQIAQDQELQKALQSLASNLVLASIPARAVTATV